MTCNLQGLRKISRRGRSTLRGLTRKLHISNFTMHLARPHSASYCRVPWTGDLWASPVTQVHTLPNVRTEPDASHYGPAVCHSVHRRAATDGHCSSFSTGLEGHAACFVPLARGSVPVMTGGTLRNQSRLEVRHNGYAADYLMYWTLSVGRAQSAESDRYFRAGAGTTCATICCRFQTCLCTVKTYCAVFLVSELDNGRLLLHVMSYNTPHKEQYVESLPRLPLTRR